MRSLQWTHGNRFFYIALHISEHSYIGFTVAGGSTNAGVFGAEIERRAEYQVRAFKHLL